MNTLPQMSHNKQESCMLFWERINRIHPQRHFWTLALHACILALAIECVAPVHLANAHPDMDPEIEKLTEKISQDPNNVDLLVLRGQIYRTNGKFNESLLDLEKAWLLDQDNRTVILQRALTLSAMGRNKEAEAALDFFLQEKTDPKRVIALAERAYIRAKTGQINSAIADFTSAIELQPTIELYLTRGKLQESQGMLEAAADGYQNGLAELGDAILLKKNLIRVLIAQKKYDEALALIKEELSRSSVKTQWYLEEAEVRGLMGQSTSSRQAHEKALSEANRLLEKRSTALQLFERAKVYQAMGRKEEAKRDLRAAIRKAPRFTKADDLLKEIESQ